MLYLILEGTRFKMQKCDFYLLFSGQLMHYLGDLQARVGGCPANKWSRDNARAKYGGCKEDKGIGTTGNDIWYSYKEKFFIGVSFKGLLVFIPKFDMITVPMCTLMKSI